MAPPKTKGPTIQFRLPLDLHDIVVMRATRMGETVNEYAARHFEKAVRASEGRVPQPTRPDPSLTERVHDPTCRCQRCRPAKA